MAAQASPPAARPSVTPPGTESPPTSSTPSAAGIEGRTARGEATPLARYAAATEPDGWLTADGWLRLAADLDDEAVAYAPSDEQARKRRDRAIDCRCRAHRLTRDARGAL